jgi:adenylate kinase
MQRDDDQSETVRRRFSVYHEWTAPVVDFYARCQILVRVDGN